MLVTLLVASLVIFLLVRLAPGDPALKMAGGKHTSEKTLQNIREKYHLNDPLQTQYFSWISGILQGELGDSYKYKQSISLLLRDRLSPTLQLMLMSMAISVLISIPTGIYSALKRNRWQDRTLSTLSVFLVSSPTFLTGIFLILLLAFYIPIFPSFGLGNSLLENFRYLFLPSLALALNMIALLSRVTRSNMIEQLGADYVMAAKAKGVRMSRVISRHALKNALIPVITVAGLQVGFLMTGTMVVEYTFGIGGLGSLLVTAIQASDYPVVQTITLLLVAIFLLINTLVDLLYAAIDPRVRLA